MTRLETLYAATERHWIDTLTALTHMTDTDVAGEWDGHALLELTARYEELTEAVDELCKRRVELLESFGVEI